MKTGMLAAALTLALAGTAWGGVLQDWTTLDGDIKGVYSDKAGSKVDLAQDEGPAGDKAVRITVDLVTYGGFWVLTKTNLVGEGSVRFKARASQPCLLQVSLGNANKMVTQTRVRVLSSEWQDYVVPMGRFGAPLFPGPDMPRDVAFNPEAVSSIALEPLLTKGKARVWVGPVTYVDGRAKARTGMGTDGLPAGAEVAQDFELLDAGAYGSFQDALGSSIQMNIVEDPGRKGNHLARLKASLKPQGWAGYWMRAGDTWGGQNWSRAKTMTLRVKSDKPVKFEVALVDANQNAYLAEGLETRGQGWETMSVPMTAFKLNPYFQPKEAKPGLPKDFTRIETFNIAPRTEGASELWVDDVKILP